MDLDIHEDQILVEFPTVGYHVVLFFDWPVPAQEAKTFARLALARAGLARGSAAAKAPLGAAKAPYTSGRRRAS